MQRNSIENAIVGFMDNKKKRGKYMTKRRLNEIQPLAERDCRECAYAKVGKDSTVRCQQKQWKDITWFRSVEAFTRCQRLDAMTCVFYHPMGDE
jgi:hypothetical protein